MGKGNIDLSKRPKVRNKDGSYSTVLSMSFEEDGQEILIPMISPDGKVLSEKKAIDLYHETGQYLGKFKSAKEADAYAKTLHEDQEKEYDGKPDSQNPMQGEGPMMTSGESAMDFGDEHQPGAKTPNSEATPSNAPQGQEKPSWVIESEKRSGVTYEYDPVKKAWRPKKGVDRAAAAKMMPPQGVQQ
jgi:hypothetical protein